MNAISYILIFLVAVAVGYGIYRMIRRKGRYACCDGNCPGCSASGNCGDCGGKAGGRNGKFCHEKKACDAERKKGKK